MERSRVTVEYKHLHQQCFEHEAEGVHCVGEDIGGLPPETLTKAQALDAVESRLQRWAGPMEGFARPVTDYAENYSLVVPQLVQFDIWPRVYACDRCHQVFQTNEDTELRRTCVVPGCGGVHRQLPYYRVHRCGRRNQLSIPKCRRDNSHPMVFHDSGSFITAYFTCRVCADRYELLGYQCNCALPDLLPQERQYRLVKARDSKAFYPHHVTVVNISARIAQALQAPRGPLWAFAHYLGQVANLTGLIDEAAGRHVANDETTAQRLLELVGATEGLTDELRESMEAYVNRNRGEEPGLRAAQVVLSDVMIAEGRKDRRLLERAFIFHQRQPEDVAAIAGRYRSEGHHGMASRMEEGVREAGELGFSRVSVVRELPIALVGFGFTRQFSDHRAQLKPLEPHERRRSATRPLVTIESNTEAVVFELDPVRLWSWCHRNGWTPERPEADSRVARAWLLRSTYAPDPTPAGLAIQRLSHAWAHTLIHALEGRSAFGPNSVAEYLLERTGSFFLYVANYSSFNLGGLTTLVEQHLADWMLAAIEQTDCVHDPVCLSERGGCHKCLALAFHCERFNRGLHRGYLLGSDALPVGTGWLQHV